MQRNSLQLVLSNMYVSLTVLIEAPGKGCNSLRLFFSFPKKQISHPSSRLLKSPGGEGGGTPLSTLI